MTALAVVGGLLVLGALALVVLVLDLARTSAGADEDALKIDRQQRQAATAPLLALLPTPRTAGPLSPGRPSASTPLALERPVPHSPAPARTCLFGVRDWLGARTAAAE